MLVLIAAIETFPVLFVFKGSDFPHLNFVRGSVVHTEILSDFFPRPVVFTCREERSGVDSAKFLVWERAFVTSVGYLAANAWKVLLTYNAYRLHMSLYLLYFFHLNGIIAYALPAHASYKTQRLDWALFASYKHHLKKFLVLNDSPDNFDIVDVYSYCYMIHRSY